VGFLECWTLGPPDSSGPTDVFLLEEIAAAYLLEVSVLWDVSILLEAASLKFLFCVSAPENHNKLNLNKN